MNYIISWNHNFYLSEILSNLHLYGTVLTNIHFTSKETLIYMNFNQFSFDSRINATIRQVGYTVPTPIQEQAIPHVLAGRDVLGLAQTGTGKTAAFMLPILNRLTQGPLRQVRALIIAPTRELAEQIHQATLAFSRKTKIRSVAIYGGVGKAPQIEALHRGVEVVVACPGRLLDLMNERQINLSQVEVLVLDEADRMCDMGFLPDIKRIIKRLPQQRQTLFFSATMPDDIRTLSNTILHNHITVQIGDITPAQTVSHVFYPLPIGAKRRFLFAMLSQTATGRVLIFTRTKHRARNLATDLKKRGYRAVALQGNMSQNKRQNAINGFRNGKFDMLVATDIAARGIDVLEISHVINFDMPDTADAYTHRIGRTGRAEQLGEAFTLVLPDDVKMVRELEKLFEKPIERRRLADFDYGAFVPETAFLTSQNQLPGKPSRRQPAVKSSGKRRQQRTSQRHQNRRWRKN